VLVVDDAPDLRILLRTRLSMLPGVEVVGEGENGADAISLTEELQPDAIVLDLRMPVMNGADAIPVLRGLDPNLRILVFSAEVENTDLSGPARPDGIVVKGADLRLLTDELIKLLGESPTDVVNVDLGEVPLPRLPTAFDAWVGANTRIRVSISAEDGRPPDLNGVKQRDLMALVGILVRLADHILNASQRGQPSVRLRLHVRRDAAQGARRALLGIDKEADLGAFQKSWGYDAPPETAKTLRIVTVRLAETLPIG
jgi:CheY-like chemotaxis protein